VYCQMWRWCKNSKCQRAIKKNTHVEMDGVSATDKTSTTTMVLTTTMLNVALTLERPWLGCKKEKQRDSHTCLSSHYLFWLQACGLFCICGLWMAHTHYFVSSLCFFMCLGLGVFLFSCSWSTTKLWRAWYRHTLSQCGVKCTMLPNSRKATLKGQGHQKKRGLQRRRNSTSASLGRL
jgi:hypothetical protein